MDVFYYVLFVYNLRGINTYILLIVIGMYFVRDYNFVYFDFFPR